MIIPTVIDRSTHGERVYDIYSRLLKDRVVFLGTAIDDAVANTVVAQLLYLDARATDDITLYINSPGGSVSAALAIYDTMRYVRSDVRTICIGQAASAAAVLLASGAKTKRFALPNSEVMIHQVLGGAQGQASDVHIHAQHILKTKQRLTAILAKHTGQKPSRVEADTDRDYFMSAAEARAYGIIDSVITRMPTSR